MNKYVKRISLIMAIIMIMAALSSCAANTDTPKTTSNSTADTTNTQQNTTASTVTPTTPEAPTAKYEALVYDFTDGVPGINVQVEYDRNQFVGKSYIDENPTMYPITYNGKQYQGEYLKTTTSPVSERIIHQYIYDSAEDGLQIEYNVDALTGELTYLNIDDDDLEENSQGKNQFSEEECVNIALKFIKAKNIDVEHLKLEGSNYWDFLYDGIYVFVFNHYVDDVRLGNNMMLMVTVYGDIITYVENITFDVDELIESKVLESIDFEAVEEALKIQSDEIFNTDEITTFCNYEYSHSIKTLSRVNGKYVLTCQTSVNLIRKNDGSSLHGYDFISVIFLE